MRGNHLLDMQLLLYITVRKSLQHQLLLQGSAVRWVQTNVAHNVAVT
jgi:hypothetical protein